MERKCGKCKGEGWLYRKGSTVSFSRFVSGDTGARKCSVCGGSGVNPNYREKRCEKCGWQTIGYHKDAKFPPKYCLSCKETVAREQEQKRQERERDNAKWREKRCSGYKGVSCYNTIRYRIDWNKVPDLCPSCIAKAKADREASKAKWKEKSCATPGCSNVIKYNVDWDKPPNICNECKEKRKADKDKWREKPCATSGCGNLVRYRTDWDHPPNYCEACKKKGAGGRYGEKLFWSDGSPLPGSDRSFNDLRPYGVQEAIVKNNQMGGYHVVLAMRDGSRYSYDTDSSGQYVTRRGHFTDEAAKLLGKDTIGPDATNRNRW